jgi:hypothetical protein
VNVPTVSHAKENHKNLDARHQAASSQAAVRVPIEDANFSEICIFKEKISTRRAEVPVESPCSIFI